MTKQLRLLLALIIVVGCCTLVGYGLYRMGDAGSRSTNAPESETKTTRQKDLDWLKAIQGIRDEPTPKATTTIEMTTSTDATTSTNDLHQETPTSTQRKQPTRGTNQK